MGSDAESYSRRWGKWSQEGVPHRGWVCVAEYDAKEDIGDLVICDMCETTEVRFVHVMTHRDYGAELHCGCVCSVHMSGDRKTADDREKRMRSRARRREGFSSRKGWKISKAGVPYINVDGYHFLIARRSDGRFQIGAKHVFDMQHTWGRRRYSSEDEAKTGCFDALEHFYARRR